MLGTTYTILGNTITIEDKDKEFLVGRLKTFGQTILDEKTATETSPHSPQQEKLQEFLKKYPTGPPIKHWSGKGVWGVLYAYAYTEGSMSPNLYSQDQQRYEDSTTWGGSGGRIY